LHISKYSGYRQTEGLVRVWCVAAVLVRISRYGFTRPRRVVVVWRSGKGGGVDGGSVRCGASCCLLASCDTLQLTIDRRH